MRLVDQFGAPLDPAAAAELDRFFAADGITVCRGCRCDDNHACIRPGTDERCHWVLLDIHAPTGVCSACAERAGFHPIALACIGQPGAIADYIPAGLERYADDIVREIESRAA